MHKAMKKKTKNKEDRKMNRRTGAFAFALALLLIVVYLAAAMPAPMLNFIDPTPANNSYQTADTVSSSSLDSSITILNPQSYPSVGENWTVRFNTTGKANRTITPVNNTYFDVDQDLRFYNESCNNGGTLLDYEIENYTSSNGHIR